MADNSSNKARNWWGVLYPENMVDNWQDKIGDILQLPYCYCVHDKDHLAEYGKKAEEEYIQDRTTHIHLIVVFSNTTTYKNALSYFDSLSKDGCRCINKVERVKDIRHAYEYLIHNTEAAKKAKKYQYDSSERIIGNLFDIGSLEQISTTEKNKILIEILDLIYQKNIDDSMTLYLDIKNNYEMIYFEVFKDYNSMIDKLCKANHHRLKQEISKLESEIDSV